MPVYNLEHYIAESIHSALNQTWGNIELIIVDDGSIDNSLEVAKKFESEKVRVFHQRNKGASAARNLGLANAKGDYIQYLDADDLLSRNKIENQLKVLNGSKDSIAICPTIYFNDGEDPFQKAPDERDMAFQYTTSNTFEFLLNLYGITGSAGMITIHSWLTPKSVLEKAGNWNEKISVDDDGEYFCRVVLNASGIIAVNDVYNYYRKYKNGKNLASQKSYSAIESTFNGLLLKEKHLLARKVDINVQKTFASFYFRLAVSCYPKYRALSKEILKKALPYLKKTPKLFIGGNISDFIANHISWRLARTIQFWKEKILM